MGVSMSESKSDQSIEATSSVSCSSQTCYIYYDDFAITRMFGLNESQIAKYYATKYDFDEEDLEQIIVNKIPKSTTLCSDTSYCNEDIKAKIVLNKKIFYIDSLGYMRVEDKYYKINKDKLVDIISSKKPLEKLNHVPMSN